MEETTEKKKRGRPTNYDPDFCNKVDEYLELCKDSKSELGIKVQLPTFEGFMQFIDVPSRTFYDWKSQHEDFSQSLDKILFEQKQRLLNMGLSGDYNSTIAKLILSANHNMKEKNVVR